MDAIFDTPGVRAMMHAWAKERFKDAVKDAERRAREAGMRKGRSEGRREGQAMALRATLTRLVRDKIGRTPRSVAARIGRCSDPARLERWVLAVGRAAGRSGVEAVFRNSL